MWRAKSVKGISMLQLFIMWSPQRININKREKKPTDSRALKKHIQSQKRMTTLA